ncbi:MAG TPA: M23 family metallopeptidase [Methylocystis sp.]|nr:M23 family metallopeptidase [Methylocystis sp.]
MVPRQSYTYVDASADYVVHVARGNSRRSFTVSRLGLYCGAASITLFASALVGAASYLFFHDDLLAGLLERQAQMQYAYEDRLAAARLRLDQLASRQFIDQDGVEGKVQNLVIRQAMLETRAAVVAQLVEHTVGDDIALSEERRSAKTGGATTIPRSASAPATAPKTAQSAIEDVLQPADRKPHPENLDLRLGGGAPSTGATTQFPLGRKSADHAALGYANETQFAQSSPILANAADPGVPMQTRLDSLALSLDRVERDQAARVERIVKPAVAAAGKLRRAFDDAGLPIERYVAKAKIKSAPAVGGPFVASDLRGGAFERDLAAAQNAVATLDGLRRALPSVPLRKPLAGELQITSTFGYRIDPFLGRPALHSGVDLREEYGEPVRATAGGVVTVAGATGGYGNMVEIDHGGGLSTRYGHLSQIGVTTGQPVAAGAIVGRVGSSGRSTGPHLHYEVREDGEAIDPARFLKAAAALSAAK